MVRKIAIFTLLAGFVALSSAPVYARESNEVNDRKPVVSEVKQAVETTTETESSEVEKTLEDREQGARDRAAVQRDQMEMRKAELEAKLRQKQAERKEKLEGRRLAMCENRQANINTLLDKSAQKGQERIARIQRFEEGVKRFYDEKNLVSEEYDAANSAVGEMKAKAEAALTVLDQEQFSCDMVDGAKPSDTLKESREMKHTALKAYRDSVINLLHVVKAAFAEQQSTAPESTEEEAN